ncbi:DUF2268 domain-containing putative Zn-dependent protease [Gracilibacillus alcaliphilus]|uniref:DUF2268 domain-containing protein n=1 Tax=Gracilibacillus alcaliphilus TaxID=1401441 RepID=UPI00195ABC48|nr:DUF2268 domain-containing protein [Gracilibacillus alcaliphilus]MBM7676610.1 uncharacterized protein YjaZ [Gracilibacillus alcaliphilus]
MNIKMLRSDKIYQKVIAAPPSEKKELYRQEMLGPYKGKWEIQQIPFRADDEHGFDVLTINNMAHLSPEMITPEIEPELKLISSDTLWDELKQTMELCFNQFSQQGITLPVSDYLFTILLGNPNSQILNLSEGYSGEGGIPGYMICSLIPNDYTLKRLKPALAHECNHNVRYQFIEWNEKINLGELIVSEGLAENFATSLYGENLIGPWVSKTDANTLNNIIKPILGEHLEITGLQQIMAYLYGDEVAKLQGLPVVGGVPYSAGYACGYHLIKYYLQKTGKSIVEATTLPANDILSEVEEFWDEETVLHR